MHQHPDKHIDFKKGGNYNDDLRQRETESKLGECFDRADWTINTNVQMLPTFP